MIYLASLEEAMKDKVEGYKFIHTKAELDAICIDNISANRVIIRRDFAHEFFTPTGLSLYIQNVRKINHNIVIDIDTNDEVITEDYIIEKLKRCRNIEELIELAIVHDIEFMDVIRTLIEHRDNDRNTLLEFSNQVSRLQSIISDLNVELESKSYIIDEETSNKLQAQSRLHALISRINYQYNVGIDKNKLFEVDRNSYDKVLYIKEITRVQYIDTFVYYLKEILKTLYSMPTRILVIEGYYADGKIPLYPNLTPHHKLIQRDVLKGDVLMLGMQPSLMQDILKNASNISILIILDRGGYSVPHVHGSNVEVLYTLSDIKDKPDDIPAGRCITYNEDNLFIKYIPDFDSMDVSAKIGAYSSMEITKKVVELIERK